LPLGRPGRAAGVIYVAALEAVALVALTMVFAGLVRSMIRQQARERELILDKLMHLAGRTWTPPPASEPVAEEPIEYDEYEAAPFQ
jgi:hypothetical protein